MNKRFQKVISGLRHHSDEAEWGCWKYNPFSTQGPVNEFCPYYMSDRIETEDGLGHDCGQVLEIDAINLLKEYDIALRMMVYQYCTVDKKFFEGENRVIRNPDQEVFFHHFMSAGETAFKLLGIENGQEVPEDWLEEYNDSN